MSDATDRNARLDALTAATSAWADKRTKEYTDKVAAVKKILKGRTGSERLANKTAAEASNLVVAQINDFLVSS